MTQPVRSECRADSRRLDSRAQNFLDAASSQPPAAQIRYDRTVVLPRNRHRTSPLLKRVERRLAQRHQPILVALARAHHHHAELFVDIAPVQADQLADAQARRVERLENCAIAQRRGRQLFGRTLRSAGAPRLRRRIDGSVRTFLGERIERAGLAAPSVVSR